MSATDLPRTVTGRVWRVEMNSERDRCRAMVKLDPFNGFWINDLPATAVDLLDQVVEITVRVAS
jgi:hypothetical protein